MTGTPPRPPRRSVVGLAALAVGLLAFGGCSTPPPPTGHLDIVEFSAEGTAGAAFGSYVLIGDLLSNGARSFTGLPFVARLPAPSAVSPKMSVSVVDLPPGSRVRCRISFNGQVVVENSGDVPGRDVVCIAPTIGG